MKHNIRLYYLQDVLINGLLFSTPIVVVYLITHISMGQVLLLTSLQFFVVALLELPSGAFADLFGRRKSIMLGAMFYSLAWVLFLFSREFSHFVVCYLFFGSGSAFLSGSVESIVYDTLKKKKEELTASKVFGRSIFYSTRVSSFTLILSGFIAKMSYSLVFLLEVLKWPFVALTAYFMQEPYTIRKKKSVKNYFRGMKESVEFSLSSPVIGFLIFLAAFIYALIYITSQYDQPILMNSGIDVAFFGLVYAFFHSLNGWVAKYAHKIEERTKPKVLLRALLLVYGVVFILLALFASPIIVLLLLTVKAANKGLESPVMLKLLNRFIPTPKRSTIISFYNLVQSITLVFASAVFTVLTDTYTINGALIIAGVLVLLVIPFVDISKSKKSSRTS